MSSIGPQMPPHLSKRKRTPEEEGSQCTKHRRSESPAKNKDEIDLDDSDDEYGPSAPAPQKASIGPSLPPSNKDEIELDSDSDPDTGPALPKPSIGPAPPPADLSSRPDASPDSDSDSEDDYGPALPGASNANKPTIGPQMPTAEPAPQRDSWMLAPPSASGYSERDPTKIRSRKFASKPSASSGPSTVSSIWTETPEEKLKRLQDSVLGRGDKAADDAPKAGKSSKEEERDRKISANIEAQRGKSLFDEHQVRREKAGEKAEEEDDPSKRGFDREKDMALGGKIGTAQRRELMNKAANFGGRFQKGSYL
ncbi:hypothetical protein FALBO_3116 [Fusarium albosuccineum]|uniref:DUF3752 domain-containing protein n=1 Tax=Fusarium albosuccineum TaxID=1237068 RepID=A0A8H4LKV1_9HYPO|nr:hypothetical protein FALBO_3116 [Fusarium albosuccineum]